MNGRFQMNGLPNISFLMGSSFLEQVIILEQALIDYPQDELKILRQLVNLASCVKEKHGVCMATSNRLLEIAETNDDRAEALISKGVVLWQERINPEEAEKLLIEAYTIAPDFQQPYENLCDMYMERKEYEKALHWGGLMCAVEGMEHIGCELEGEALIALNRLDDAIKAFETAIKLEGNASTSNYGLSRCYAMQENYEAARDASITAFEKCHYPEATYAYSAGYCYQQLDDPYRAMKWYSKALDIDPTLPEALNNMAVLSLNLSNGWEEALPYLLKAVELSNEAINPAMRLVYRNLWAYHKQILDEEKAAYYSRLNYKCLGFDDDTIDTLGLLGDE